MSGGRADIGFPPWQVGIMTVHASNRLPVSALQPLFGRLYGLEVPRISLAVPRSSVLGRKGRHRCRRLQGCSRR